MRPAHQTLGLRYIATAAAFLLVGLLLAILMRLQLAYPAGTFPWLEAIFPTQFPGGAMAPEFYNQLGAMHGTIMVFLGVVPMAVGGFGNLSLPTLCGVEKMSLPRLNLSAYVCYVLGGLVMLASFFAPGGAAQAGWTSYAPLATMTPSGQTWWLVGMIFISFSSIFIAVSFIVTVIHSRAIGKSFFDLPIFVWAQLSTALLLLLAFPPLQGAALLQLSDRLLGSHFFSASSGGNAILWQHLFWFLAHPEVYALILPAIGIVSEIFTRETGKKVYGYRTVVASIGFLTVMSFLVWAHHMFLTGMSTSMSAFFQATTMIISIPSVVMLTSLLLTLWGGPIPRTVPMLFSLAFLPMFGLGGLAGLPLGLTVSNVHLHDTYYVIGHFHYIVAPGTLFALFAGFYYWYPRITARALSPRWGKWHFWGSFLCMNGVFFPMFLVGMAGVSRRMYDLSLYRHGETVFWLNRVMSYSSWALALVQLVFLANVLASLRRKNAG